MPFREAPLFAFAWLGKHVATLPLGPDTELAWDPIGMALPDKLRLRDYVDHEALVEGMVV